MPAAIGIGPTLYRSLSEELKLELSQVKGYKDVKLMRIGITQELRLLKIMAKKGCLDQNWTKLLTNLGLICVIPNSLIDIVSWLEINKIRIV